MHALGLGVPLVTFPGDFNPGRMAYAFFQKLGITDSVATSRADFVERSIRIANDPSLRKSLRSRILDRCDVLFANRAAAAELEAFFVDAVARCEDGYPQAEAA
jgi:predicted O-linked N-acetylglucosamine transferase (SPINDLY family)